MSVIILESDAGTKKATKRATRRTSIKLSEDMKRSLGQWWDEVLMDAIFLCPKETGALSRTIRVEPLVEELAGGFAKEATITESGLPQNLIGSKIVAGGELDSLTGRFVNYAQARHDGHLTRSGGWVEGVPFLTEAIEMNMPKLDMYIAQALDKMEREWKKQ